jgi:hypothetical protein
MTSLPYSAQEDFTIFAFDDRSIPFTRNLKLEMTVPERHPENPVLVRGEPGTPDCNGVQFYGSIIKDDGHFRMWYIALDEELRKWPVEKGIFRPSYAESTDGVNWTRPSLGLVEYKGSTENNLLKISPGPMGFINLKVLMEPDDPDPKKRYKMSAQTWWHSDKGFGRGTLVTLFSADGFSWNLVQDFEPIKGAMPVEAMCLPRHHFEAAGGLYKWNGKYYATGQGCSDHDLHRPTPYSGREVLIHRSEDFINWAPTAHIAFVREGQHRSFECGSGEETHEGVSVWNRNNVLLGFHGVWHGDRDKKWEHTTVDLGISISNDGLYFREPLTEHIFLKNGEDGAWDQGGILQGQGFENIGEKTHIYYGAWDPRPGGEGDGEEFPPRGGLGIALLERDRFGSLSPRKRNEPADFITTEIPLAKTGCLEIFINATGLGEKATLRIEILDTHEHPLALFAGSNAAIVRLDGFRTMAEFAAELKPDTLPHSIRLRVSFEGKESQQIQLSALYLRSSGV